MAGDGIKIQLVLNKRDFDALTSKLDSNAIERLDGELRSMMVDYGDLLLQQVRVNASGRPGPQVVTGAYRASWQAANRGNQYVYQVVVFSNHPAANRLEYGFTGTDSLGRQYNQPPFPHVHPATARVFPQFAGALQELASGWFER